ncbi:serine hydrolase domain-containing protein [Streptomyces sp. NBC_01465]|uniref:serine hydrolase domain-containing protein n=1 Tax=Streptomyces sp. NBC_01465 TaxID=2903878 RepID=UPI002E2EBC9B|nr:serine hydrolase [Streptomyces sp. NBC_01465]
MTSYERTLLPRSAPAALGVSSRAITMLLDRLEEESVECHSIMVVRRGHVIAEGWWAPYSAERVTGRGLPEYLDERLFTPMGVDHAEWDRAASGAAFGFHGLHLTTEAVAAFGELLRCGGMWGGQQLVPRAWVELATRRHIDCEWILDGTDQTDFARGYGYQFWMSRNGFHGHGSFGQRCVVVPSLDLVLAVTAQGDSQEVFDALWECLLPGMDRADSAEDDEILADLYVIATPHRVRLLVDADTGTATARWSAVPLTGLRLELHVRVPLMTRSDVA